MRGVVHLANEKHPLHPHYVMIRAKLAALQPCSLATLCDELSARIDRATISHSIDVLARMDHVVRGGVGLRLTEAGAAAVEPGNATLTADPPVLPDTTSANSQFFCTRKRSLITVGQCAGNWQHRCAGEPCARGGPEGCPTGAAAFQAGKRRQKEDLAQRSAGIARRNRARRAA